MRPIRRLWKSSVVGAGPALRVSTETLAETARHLRHIQFYYMLVCLGLLLAVYLPRDTTLDKASTQLDEVIRFQSEVGDEPLWEIAGMARPEWTGPRKPLAALLFRLYRQAFSTTGADELTPTIADWVDLDEQIGGQQYTRGIQLQRSTSMIGGPVAAQARAAGPHRR